jgi:plastocyanin
MNRWVALITVVVVIIGLWFVLGNKKSTAPTSSSASVATDQVTIAGKAFTPPNITIKKGTKVTWTNQDSVQHTVTEDDGQNGPGAAPFDQGQTYSFTYDQAGTFHYHCAIHNEMTGTVVVTD